MWPAALTGDNGSSDAVSARSATGTNRPTDILVVSEGSGSSCSERVTGGAERLTTSFTAKKLGRERQLFA